MLCILPSVRFDERFLDDLKSRLRPSDVIGRTVKLRKQGREFSGLSPFTSEKTPSFFVNDEKGQFFCFSSGKTGDLISFLQETQRLSFTEAVEALAAEAGMALPAQDPAGIEQDRRRKGLSDWLETAAQWFEAELRRPGGRAARNYLESRGLGEAEWARFRLGFAPAGRTTLKDYLVAKGALVPDLVETGLLIQLEDGQAPYDRFRDRIIFPIADPRARILSFGGRAMDPQARAKYLNGPETSLFHKGRELYGLPEARNILRAAPAGDQPPLVVVEGYMDAIACHRAGVAAVAPMGTALTEEQMEALWRHHPEPTLCFDGDRAGRQAAARAMDRALPLLKAGRSLKFAIVEGGKDPDDVLREQGPAALKAQLARTTAFADALFTRERDLEALDTPERRAGLKARLRQAAGQIADRDLAVAYREDLLARLDQLFARAPAEGGRRPWTPGARRSAKAAAWYEPSTPEGKAAAKRLDRGLEPHAAALAAFALEAPQVLDAHLEEAFTAQGFGDPALAPLTRELVRLRLDAERLDTEALRRHLAACGFSALLTDIDRAAAVSGAPFTRDDVSLEARKSQWSSLFGALSRAAALDDAIETAKGNLARRSDMAALERLKGERDALKRAIRTGTLWAAPES